MCVVSECGIKSSSRTIGGRDKTDVEVGIEEGISNGGWTTTIEEVGTGSNGGGTAGIGREEVSIDGKREAVISKEDKGEEESTIEGSLVISDITRLDCGNQWEKSDVKGVWGAVYEEEWTKGNRDSLNKA